MENYLLVVYVTLQQEQAIKHLFEQNDWCFSKPDVTKALDILSRQAAPPGESVAPVLEGKAAAIAPGHGIKNTGITYDGDATVGYPEFSSAISEFPDELSVICKAGETDKAIHVLSNDDVKNTLTEEIVQEKILMKVKAKHSIDTDVEQKGRNQKVTKGKKNVKNDRRNQDDANGKHLMQKNKSKNIRDKKHNGSLPSGNKATIKRKHESTVLNDDTVTVTTCSTPAEHDVEDTTAAFENTKLSAPTCSVENRLVTHIHTKTAGTLEIPLNESDKHEGKQTEKKRKRASGKPKDNVFDNDSKADSGIDTATLNGQGSIDNVSGNRTKRKPKTNVAENRLWSCTKCRKSFKSSVVYKKHQVIDRCQLICPYCGRNFNNRYTSFKRHLKFVHTEVNLATSADSISKTSPALISSQPISNDSDKEKKNSIECPDCHLTFEKKHTYEKHRRLAKCKSACPFCQKVFINNYHYLQMHIRRMHTNERPYVCSACGEGFVNVSLLNIHEREHAGETFPCNICGVVFSKQGQMFTHRKSHSQQTSWLCDLCGSEFGSAARLRFHKARLHSDARPYGCQLCPQRFKDKSDLIKHSVTHSDLKKYQCNLCNKSFKLRQGLTLHERRHKQDYRHFCSHCNKGFIQKGRLTEHIRIHVNEKPFECRQCTYKCCTASNLKKHLNVHTRNVPRKRNQREKDSVPRTQNVQSIPKPENYPNTEGPKLPDAVPIVSCAQNEDQRLPNYQMLISDEPKASQTCYQPTSETVVNDMQQYYLAVEETSKPPHGYNVNVLPLHLYQNSHQSGSSSHQPITITSMNVNDLSGYMKLPSMSVVGEEKTTHYVIPQHLL